MTIHREPKVYYTYEAPELGVGDGIFFDFSSGSDCLADLTVAIVPSSDGIGSDESIELLEKLAEFGKELARIAKLNLKVAKRASIGLRG